MNRKNIQHKATITSQGFTITVQDEVIAIKRVYAGECVELIFDKNMVGPLYSMMKETKKQWDEANDALELLGDSNETELL